MISEKNFIKEARAWDTYKSDYRPVVEFAKVNKLKVIAANAPSRYTNIVTRKGLTALDGLSKHVRDNFIAPLPVDTMTGKYYDRFMEVMGGHSTPGMNLYQSQNFWDATMSWSIAKYLQKNKGFKVLQLNGRFHSDEHLGTLAQLQKRLPKVKIANISAFSADDFSNPDWEKYKGLGDYIIVSNPALKRTF